MIKFEKTETCGWEAAIRGMRNPMNSWEKSDSGYGCTLSDQHMCGVCEGGHYDSCPDRFRTFVLGPNDLDLMRRLAKGGPVHAKYRRQIFVSVDITAPLYWWKEFDTYKVGTTANSCSTMHKIHAKEFTREDFSCEKLVDDEGADTTFVASDDGHIHTANFSSLDVLDITISALNFNRKMFLETKEKIYWDQMIQLLPSSYNQKRTVTMTYENLYNMYQSRKDHKLSEWRVGFCGWAKSLPYSELFTMSRENTSFQEDLDFFVNDCTNAQLKALYERVKEKLGEGRGMSNDI